MTNEVMKTSLNITGHLKTSNKKPQGDIILKPSEWLKGFTI
jgi:hypothetical protein